MPIINASEGEYVLLVTAHHPVVLGLSKGDLEAFVQHVSLQRVPVSPQYLLENNFALAA